MKHKVNSESKDLHGMRESIEEMEQELKGMEKDIEDAKKIPDLEMREVAVRNVEKMRKSAREMIASFKKTYKTITMKKLVVVAILMGAGSALACPSGAAYVQPVVVPAVGVSTAGAVTVVQRERQIGLLPVVGDAVAGVATAVFGSDRPVTTVVATAPQTTAVATTPQTMVASDSGCAAAIAALPIPTVGDLIPVQTKTKVFVPGRYVVVRSTYGELVQMWQPSHYETVIVNN